MHPAPAVCSCRGRLANICSPANSAKAAVALPWLPTQTASPKSSPRSANSTHHKNRQRLAGYAELGITGQSMRDLVSWHGRTFKSRHDSFCPIKTGVARDFCETWPLHFWGPPDKCLGAVSGKSDSNEKKK